MKTITIEIPEGKKAEWVDGVLTLVDDKPVELKFKVGDRVKIKRVNQVQTITSIALLNGNPVYKTDGNSTLTEGQIELYAEPKDITERIKTFEDACKWCKDNDKQGLYEQYADAINVGLQRAKDISAYLKLRIITCALNEGWEPTFEGGEQRWYAVIPDYGKNNKMETFFRWQSDLGLNQSSRLFLKAKALAEYAATQFKDIYMDFCYKGKE